MFLINDKWQEELDLTQTKAGDEIQAKALKEELSVLFCDGEECPFCDGEECPWYEHHTIERRDPKSHIIIRRKPKPFLDYKTYHLGNEKITYTREAIRKVTLVRIEEVYALVRVIKPANRFFKGKAEVFYNKRTEEQRIEQRAW